MSDNWEKVDTREFMADVQKAASESYKMHGHSFTKRKRLPWVICQTCGLVSLRNGLTAWCDKMGCLYSRHPEYHRQRSMKRVA